MNKDINNFPSRIILLLIALIATVNVARAEQFKFRMIMPFNTKFDIKMEVVVTIGDNSVSVKTTDLTVNTFNESWTFSHAAIYHLQNLDAIDFSDNRNSAIDFNKSGEYFFLGYNNTGDDKLNGGQFQHKLQSNYYKKSLFPEDINAYRSTFLRMKSALEKKSFTDSYSTQNSTGGSSNRFTRPTAPVTKCFKCNGSGKCNSPEIPEIYCHGTGVCQHCHGTGNGILGTVCFGCHGSGKCYFCGGTGVCSKCLGTGYLSNGISAPAPQSQASPSNGSSSTSSSASTYRPSTSSSSSSTTTSARRSTSSSSSSSSSSTRRSSSSNTATRAAAKSASKPDLPYSVAAADGEACAFGAETVKESDGSTFTGLTRPIKMTRAGILRKPNGDVFTGYLLLKRIPSEGKMEYHNGDIFVGKFKKGKRSNGTLRYASGKTFTGDFDDKGNPSKGTWR